MWECLEGEGDPKLILRQVSLPELSVLVVNIDHGEGRLVPTLDKFVVVQMIKVEMMYRKGLVDGDWTFLRLGNKINLRYSLIPHKLTETFHEIEPVGWATA